MKKERDQLLVNLGCKIRQYRIEKQLTQMDLAVITDSHKTQIARIERGEHNVGICTLKRIADALGIGVTELISHHP